MIEVRCKVEANTVVLEIVGEVCVVTAPALASCIDAALETEARHLALDLAEVTVFGATAANLVVETARRLSAAGGLLTLRRASGLTAYVLEVSGLGALVERSELSAAS